MKNLKYLFLSILAGGALTSCLDDGDSLAEQITSQPNTVAFVDANFAMVGVADGRTIDYELPLNVVGPTTANVDGDVTIDISVNSASTAVEGTHFELTAQSFTLTAAKGYRDKLPVRMLTDGIVTPLAEDPLLVLNIASATTSDKVVASGKPITISMLYLCPSDLSGAWSVSIDYFRPDFIGNYNYTDVLTQTGDGQYRTQTAGHWAPGSIGGEPGYDLIDVCGNITIPAQNLVNLYSNIVEGVSGLSTADEGAGTMYHEYTVCASDCRVYQATFTR